jgi:glutathione S-transferase
MTQEPLADRIYHLALGAEWREAQAGGQDYRRSTVGRSLEDEGFIHCSFAHQVRATADRYYAGLSDVVLLVIDPSRLDAEVRVETPEGAHEAFPHIYGPIPVDAVVEVRAAP